MLITDLSKGKYVKVDFKSTVSSCITKPRKSMQSMKSIEDVQMLKEEKDSKVTNKKALLADLEIAKQMQINLLPKPLHKKKISIEGYYDPEAFLGGDFYYWKKVDHFKYGMILFDVMGHGIATSMICMYIRSLLPGIMDIREPKIAVEELNKHMIAFNKAINHQIDYYFTAIYVVIDTHEQTVEYINAGHPRAIIYYKDGRCIFLEEGCLPIGIVPNLKIKKGRISYNEAFEMLLYSDGINNFLGVNKDKVLDRVNNYYKNNHKDFDSFFHYIIHNMQLTKGEDDISIIHIRTMT